MPEATLRLGDPPILIPEPLAALLLAYSADRPRINVDLATLAGRANLVAEAGLLGGGKIDGVLAIAGLAAPIPATVGVNFFGMVATLEGLRPLLVGSPAPRAVGVSSMASLMPVDDELVAAMGARDEVAALARAGTLAETEEGGALIYAST
ncbi:MAG TPA: hypothetical protein VIK31_09810, partial [Propionibacteriaceae bacterium]